MLSHEPVSGGLWSESSPVMRLAKSPFLKVRKTMESVKNEVVYERKIETIPRD